MSAERPIMFYDGECPLCRREVAHYRRLDRERRIDWSDITREPERLEKYGISLCKITRGSKVLKKNGSVALKLLDSMN